MNLKKYVTILFSTHTGAHPVRIEGSLSGDALVPAWLHNYSRLAYTWWVVAYITGAILVMSKRAAVAG